MIEIKNFSKRFGKRIIYDNISLSLPRTGVVAIVGESGSGKTTLLNAIAGLDFDYDGEIEIDFTNLKNLNEDNLCDYRIHNIGYVFQNFNLLNLDDVETNILLPFESTSNNEKIIKERKIKELTRLLGISKLKKENVNKLSGGEKQRVAIARAMVNSPKVILCDEPTGALDENNSEQIYAILKKISSKSLILIASHDFEGVSRIADKIIYVKDGSITEEDRLIPKDEDEQNLLENTEVVKKSFLSLGFKIKHSLHKLKSKKYRSLITNGMLSLSLTGIGLSIILSTSVSNKIQEAFSSLVNGNQIVMSLKQESQNTFSNAYSAPLNNVQSIFNKYSYYIEDIGCTYLVNFEDFFKDGNEFYVSSTFYGIDIPALSTRSINDFKWIDDSEMIMYPFTERSLKNDEVVLGLTYQDMTKLCFDLQILRNFSSLGHYINEHGLTIALHVQNNDWQYEDEQIFEVKAVTEAHETMFYHSNPLWNEEVFENMMLIPSDDDHFHYFPWEMFKVYYFQTYNEPSVLLNLLFYDEEYQDYVFERTNYDYHPTLCPIDGVCEEKRILIYMADKSCIVPGHINNLLQNEPSITNYYFISDFGYASYASNLLSGFSKSLFISCDEQKVLEAVDADEQLNEETNIEINLPQGVVQGNFLNGISGGLRFSTKMDNLITGRKPTNNKEIVISKGLVDQIDSEGIGIGKYLFVAGENNEFLDQNEHLEKEYKIEKVVIVGIVDEEKNYVYHDELWTISFFRDCLGVSSFYLIPKSVVFELDINVDSKALIEKFNKMFHQYNFSSPINELSSSIESTLQYANAILIGFSILASLISILLLGTVVLLNVLESKDEINLFHVVGIKQKDINSLFVYQSLVQGLISFAFSAIEIVLVDYVISKALGESMHTSIGYTFNVLPIAIVFLFAVFLPYFTSLILIKILAKKKSKSIAKSNLN